MELPKSPASERNKEPILNVLRSYEPLGDLLEIGHGTGQHAIHFCSQLDVSWFPADIEENNWMMQERRKRATLSNLHQARVFEVGLKPVADQVDQSFDSIFTANTFHIMAEAHAFELCENMDSLLKPGGRLFLYGPFKFNGLFTSESNDLFDQHLKSRNPQMGIRDFETIERKLGEKGIRHIERHDLPANNHLLVFQYET